MTGGEDDVVEEEGEGLSVPCPDAGEAIASQAGKMARRVNRRVWDLMGMGEAMRDTCHLRPDLPKTFMGKLISIDCQIRRRCISYGLGMAPQRSDAEAKGFGALRPPAFDPTPASIRGYPTAWQLWRLRPRRRSLGRTYLTEKRYTFGSG